MVQQSLSFFSKCGTMSLLHGGIPCTQLSPAYTTQMPDMSRRFMAGAVL